MSASEGSPAVGITLSVDLDDPTGATASYVQIAEISEMTAPEITRSEYNLTHLTSDDDTEEYEPGMINSGTMTLSGNIVMATAGSQIDASSLIGAIQAAVVDTGSPTITRRQAYKVTFNDAAHLGNTNNSTLEFVGFPTRFVPGSNVGITSDRGLMFEMTLRVSGKVTATASS